VKRIIIVIEATDYGYIMEVEPPNLTRLDPHPAVGWGLGSRPACGAVVGGMLPVCMYPECHHRTIKDRWSNPFFLTAVQKATERQFLLCGNGWALELLLPWMHPEDRRLSFWAHDNHEALPFKNIVDHFLEKKNGYESYFALLWGFESHWPFYSPKGHDRREALLFLDGQVGRILEACKDAEIVVCSDHNLPPRVVSAAADVPAPRTMLSFIATNFTETRGWGELGVDPHRTARERWSG